MGGGVVHGLLGTDSSVASISVAKNTHNTTKTLVPSITLLGNGGNFLGRLSEHRLLSATAISPSSFLPITNHRHRRCRLRLFSVTSRHTANTTDGAKLGPASPGPRAGGGYTTFSFFESLEDGVLFSSFFASVHCSYFCEYRRRLVSELQDRALSIGKLARRIQAIAPDIGLNGENSLVTKSCAATGPCCFAHCPFDRHIINPIFPPARVRTPAPRSLPKARLAPEGSRRL